MTLVRVPAVLGPDTSMPLLVRSVGDQLRLQAGTVGQAPAVMWTHGNHLAALTYRELLTAGQVAAATIARYAQPGQRVCVWAANCVQWVILEYASALAGTILAPLNTAWTDDEVCHALQLTTPAMLFAGLDNRGADLRERAAHLAADTTDCHPVDLQNVAIRPDPAPFDAPTVSPHDPFLIQFTSGTTGRAKGATLSHRAALNAGHIRALTFDAGTDDVWVNPIPLHHVGGSVIIVLAALCSGGCYVAAPRFDPSAQVALMTATRATHIGGVPTMFYALLDTPGFADVLATLRSVGLGGSSVPPSMVERLANHGPRVSLAYAQSECPMVTQSDPTGDSQHVATTVGMPVPHTELRILAPDGHIVVRGEVGEVCVRSPLTMTGYWDRPEATAEVFDADGFLHTGDLGSIDADGVVRIHGRARELIIRGGENIYPGEIEDVLMGHPAVAAAAVLATPSQRWGEEVAAVVKPAASGAVTADELQAYARKRLAHFKIPRRWRFVDDLPLTASGKVRKVDLPALFTTEDGS